MSFRDTVILRIQQNAQAAERERDAEWQRWFEAGGIFEAIRYPELAKPPSQRTQQEIRTQVLRESGGRRGYPEPGKSK